MTEDILISGYVKSSIKNTIATIEFHHPAGNSLPSKILQKLADEIHLMGSSENVTVIVLKSFGEKAFCGGASFDELLSIDDFVSGKTFFSGFAKVINAIRTCNKFVIGRVQGKAVGGGVGIASAVDYCLAHESASVKLSELAVGIGPFVVGPAVERKIGLSAFSELAINASEWRDANWAKSKGLYMSVFSEINLLDQAVDSLANTLSKNSTEAMMEIKKMLWKGTEHWDSLLYERAEISGKLVLTPFTKNYLHSFKSSKA